MKRQLKVLVVITLAGYLISRFSSAIHSYNAFTATLHEIYHSRNLSYQEKMHVKYPRYYDYIGWIKTVTPADAVIFQTDLEIPYGEPLWPSNNIQMNSAWLYPRLVVPWNGTEAAIKDEDHPTYIMVIDGFPRADVASKKVVIFDQGTTQIEGNYIHDNYASTKLGLIEL